MSTNKKILIIGIEPQIAASLQRWLSRGSNLLHPLLLVETPTALKEALRAEDTEDARWFVIITNHVLDILSTWSGEYQNGVGIAETVRITLGARAHILLWSGDGRVADAEAVDQFVEKTSVELGDFKLIAQSVRNFLSTDA